MPVTFVHIGDFHANPDRRNAARYEALDQIIREGAALPTLGAWLWPGDLFHARSTIEDRNALAERLQRMANVAPVVLCYGNHDLPGDLDVFGRLHAIWPIFVVSRPECVRLELANTEGGDPSTATIFVLPYPTKGGLVGQGVSKGDVVDTGADLLEPIFMQAAGDIFLARARGDLTLMIGHVNVAGSLTSVGQPNIGHEIELSPRHLDRLGAIPKLLNHIHKAQSIGGAHYAGSVCRMNWGEIEAKEYLDVTYFGDAGGEWGLFHHPIDVAPMYHVEGVLTRDAFTWQVTAGPGGDVLPAPASWRGCEVRVRYRFNQSDRSVLRDAPVLAEFAEAAHLELEPIAVPDRALRAPAVAVARTLADKVTAWGTVNQQPVAAAVLDKLAHLERADALQVLSTVQTAIAALEAPEKATVAA